MNHERDHAYDHESERAVLGCVLLDGSCIPVVRSVLSAGPIEFTFGPYATLYRLVLELSDAGRPVDGVVIRDELIRKSIFEETGGYERLKECIAAVGSSHRAKDYAEIVHANFMRREAAAGGQRIVAMAHGGVDVTEIIQSAAALYESLSDMALSEVQQDGSVAGLLDDDIWALMDGQAINRGIPTGFFQLDEMLNGLQPGQLTVIAARPSFGKTTLARCIADRCCVTDGVPTLFFSLEMRAKTLLWMWAAARARVNGHLLLRGIRQAETDIDSMRAAASEIKMAADRLRIFDKVRNLDMIVNLSRLSVRRHGTRVIFIDYLGLMQIPHGRRDERTDERYGRGVTACKAMANETDAAVVLLTQANRGPEKEDRAPRASDLHNSDEILMHADTLIFVHQEAKYSTQAGNSKPRMASGPVEFIVAKQRVGPTGVCAAEFKAAWARFDNPCAQGSEEA
ncbi:MAG: replicative DNA helicase [Bradyrhizobium sp.]|uniref:replicative DNA helicase n=1 Tax=Bradyrhizobium sp. TaxID=376 RepID=UPI003D0ABA72